MSLRFALLGFLSTSPASGYTLGQKFADGAGAMWEALPSQIYPELVRMEKAGLIKGETDRSDKLNRRVYRVTPNGRAALREWVEADASAHPAERDAERVRFLFLDRSDPAVIREHAERYRAHYENRLALWRADRDAIAAGTHERMRDRLADAPGDEHRFVTGMKWFAFEGLVRRAETEIRWASDLLAWLDTLGDSKSHANPPFAEASNRSKRANSTPRRTDFHQTSAASKARPTTTTRRPR